MFADEVNEQRARFDILSVGHPIDRHLNLHNASPRNSSVFDVLSTTVTVRTPVCLI
jgi:hypothetical protein